MQKNGKDDIDEFDDINEIDTESKINTQDRIAKSLNIVISILLIIAITSFIYTLWTLRSNVEIIDNIKNTKKSIELRYEKSSRTDRIKHLIDEIDNLYNEYYTGELDYDLIEKMVVTGFVMGTNDKYGAYLTEKGTSDYSDKINERLVGIGVEVVYEEDGLYVTDVYEGSPAKKSGITIGDKIKSVEDTDVTELGLDGAIKMIKGKQGTEVRISLEDRELTIERDLVKTPYVKYDIIDGIGYIKIKSFTMNTGDVFKDIMEELQKQGINKFVFDLRSNGGGLLDSIVETLDYLLPEGLIVRIEDKYGSNMEFSSDKEHVDGEMVVLVNNETASAAELFTLALRDYDKATVIGTKTYGKGTSATTIPISAGSVNISTALYYTKSSPNIEGVGIEPDIVLEYESDVPLYKAKYSEDNQLQKALEILK